MLLALDRRGAALLGRGGPARQRWVLCADDGLALDDDFPLLAQVTAGQGLKLLLAEQSASAGSAFGPWRQRRSAHVPAGSGYARALDGLAGVVTQLVAQALVDLRLGVCPALAQLPPPRVLGPAPAQASVRRQLLAGRWRSWCALQRSRWLSEHWRIGLIDAPVIDWVQSGGRLPVRWITPPSSAGYWADPMGMAGDPSRLFCEYFDERSGRGHLQALRLDAKGQVASREPLAVGSGGHLSFPLVVVIDGRRLGLVESAADRECVLYEVDDQGRWRRLVTLLRGVAAADPALFAWGGRYWLAYTDLALGALDNLCLHHAPALEGPWQPHANNPVKLDVTAARMAGGLFSHGGQLYRPAQDCLAGYGAAVTLHRVLHCTPEVYLEEPVARIAPDPAGPCPDGLHTLSAWGDRTLIDGKRLGLNPVSLLRKLRERLGAAPVATARQPLAAGVRRVAVYIPHLRVGGGELSLLRLATGFAAAGLPVDLIVNTLDTAEMAVPEGLHLVNLEARGTLGGVRRLAQVLRQRQPQCLLSGFPHTNVAAVAAVALSGVDCRCVVSEHAPLSHQIRRQGGWRYRLLPPLVRWAYRRADAVVPVSAGVAEDLSAMLGPGLRLQVIANPVLAEVDDAVLARQPLHPWLTDARLQVVLGVSRLVGREGHPHPGPRLCAAAHRPARHPAAAGRRGARPAPTRSPGAQPGPAGRGAAARPGAPAHGLDAAGRGVCPGLAVRRLRQRAGGGAGLRHAGGGHRLPGGPARDPGPGPLRPPGAGGRRGRHGHGAGAGAGAAHAARGRARTRRAVHRGPRLRHLPRLV